MKGRATHQPGRPGPQIAARITSAAFYARKRPQNRTSSPHVRGPSANVAFNAWVNRQENGGASRAGTFRPALPGYRSNDLKLPGVEFPNSANGPVSGIAATCPANPGLAAGR